MSGIDDVLERLVTDAAFARQLAQNPGGALAGYELSHDDLTLLSTTVSFDLGAVSAVEERTSKSAMFGLLSSFAEGLGGLAGGAGGPTGVEAGGIIDDNKLPGESVGIIDDNKLDGDAAGIIDDNKLPGESVGIIDDNKLDAGVGAIIDDNKLPDGSSRTGRVGEDLLIGGTTIFDDSV